MIEAPASKSFGAARARPQNNRISPLVWMNLVCLDAPLVAVSWQWLFARSFRIEIPPGTTPALFLTAWLIYLADRLADARSLGAAPVVSLRQRFCLRHEKAWIAAVVVIAIADLFAIAKQLDRSAVLAGAVVGAAAFVYLLINRFAPSIWRVLPLKEISIGFIFAAGTIIGLLHGLTTAALPAWILFASLCALNCISIAAWERELDLQQRRISIATEFRAAGAWLLPVLVLACTASCILATLSSERALHLCSAASALFLGIVHVLRARIQPDVRTALADVVLLTPLISLGAWR